MSPSKTRFEGADCRIGIDVGGTNTDAVLISRDPISILASHKAPTTADITTGITNAVRKVIASSGVHLSAIRCVIIGTTHFLNAVIQRSGSLRQVAVMRLCGGATEGFGRGVPPFIDFPADLRNKIEAKSFFCGGGYQISGDEISPLNKAELIRVADELVKLGHYNVVISGMYSPMNATQELQAKEIIATHMNKVGFQERKVRITMSHEVSQLGFLSRENAAILNAALRPLAEHTILAFQTSIAEIFSDDPCAIYLTQNDGSVLKAVDAIELPIRTFNSGPTNSIRGGEFLWKLASNSDSMVRPTSEDPLVVVDIGGTTSDSGLLLANGMPRMSSLTSFIGGVRTNFALPAVESIGLGGGSIIREEIGGEVTVGPDCVGLELMTRAKVFGGRDLTSSDVAVASKNENPFGSLADPTRVADITPQLGEAAQALMRKMVEELVDRTKIQKGDIDVLVVGGGAFILDLERPFEGVRAVRTVKGGEVANAIGAAISRISSVVDTVVETTNQTLKQAQNTVAEMAREQVISQGAESNTVHLAEMTVLPIQYVDSKARIIARAIGELGSVSSPALAVSLADKVQLQEYTTCSEQDSEQKYATVTESLPVNLETYEPLVQDCQWIISPTDLELIAAGCKILGCGGGGDPYQEYLKAKSILKDSHGSIRVVSPSFLSDNSLVGWTGCMGSPEVSMERLENDECLKAHEELLRVTGTPPVSGFLALEIGGGNGVVNLCVAAQSKVPCVDADFMGRAYPTMHQVTPNIYGAENGDSLVPATIASGDGTFLTITGARTDSMVDKALRAACVQTGCRAGNAGPPKSAKVVREQAVPNTVSLAWWVGRAIALEKDITDKMRSMIDVLGGSKSAAVLAEGKVVNVERVLKTGHTYGILEVEGKLNNGVQASIKVPFKNENAYVEAVLEDGSSTIIASVPDLIVVLDAETGCGLGTPEYKYGLRVIVVAIAASPRWTDSARGMKLGGPSSMGFDDVQYKPIGQYSQPKSVIDAFDGRTKV